MTATRPLVEMFIALDDLLERVDRTWWGAVVSHSRFPLIWDVNYARVDGPRPDLTLQEVRSALVPAVREAGVMHEHIVLFDPDGSPALLHELERSGSRLLWDTAMELPGPRHEEETGHRVKEVTVFDQAFWDSQRLAMAEFDVRDADVIEQLVAWERDLLVPFGKRWFAVREDGDIVGSAALVRHGEVGYIDNVVTFPRARRRGIAAAMVVRVAEEAFEDGATRMFLLADRPGPIRLYERLGFRSVGRIASSLRPLGATAGG